jgi:hypothetical protein
MIPGVDPKVDYAFKHLLGREATRRRRWIQRPLPAPLQQRPLVRRALEELKMLTQTDLERERSEARRKAQLDYQTGLNAARLEGREEGLSKGREEGLTKGEKIGIIHLCERMLNRPQTPSGQLAALPLEDLTRLADELQARLVQKP